MFGLFSCFVDADYDKVRIPPVLDNLSALKLHSCVITNGNSAIINWCSTNNPSTVDLPNQVNIDRRICIENPLMLHNLSLSFDKSF